MLKLLDTNSFYKDEEPTISILNLSALSAGLEKVAAHEDIQAYLDVLEPKPGFTYLHINAMTAGEYHGANRNADYFPEDNLKKYYKTFETSPAYVYRSHINKDPKKSYGKVLFAVYNERMHRVELVCECPDELVADINQRITRGEFPTTSMACRTPADTCSICGNRATSRQAYCKHLKSELNKLYPDGRRVMAINDQPLSFFDISIVVRPADVNSSILQKVADAEVMGSAELAEVEGLTEDGFHKRAALKKLSELVKEITDGCYVVGAGKTTEEILGQAAPKDLPLGAIDMLHHFELPQTLSAMANMGISPSVSFLAELITRKKLGPGYEGIGQVVQNFLNEVPDSVDIPAIHIEEPTQINPLIDRVLSKFVGDSSLFPGEIEKRASNVGYSGNGPYIEPTREEELARLEAIKVMPEESVSYSKLLLTIGGLALLSKYYITSQIEKKLREKNNSVQNNAKIVLVKKASDYLVTAQLAKLAMVQSLPKHKSQNEQSTDGSSDPARLGMFVTKRVLSNTKTKVGGKLANLMRLFSLGHKLTTLG